MVERGGLENRCPLTGTEGSNPSLSATFAVNATMNSISHVSISCNTLDAAMMSDVVSCKIETVVITALTPSLTLRFRLLSTWVAVLTILRMFSDPGSVCYYHATDLVLCNLSLATLRHHRTEEERLKLTLMKHTIVSG